MSLECLQKTTEPPRRNDDLDVLLVQKWSPKPDLDVVIEAPVEAINAVIKKHDDVRALVDNGWLNLFALDESGRITARYRGNCAWAAETSRRLGEAA